MYSVQPVYTVQRRQNCTKLINQFLVGILSVSDVTLSLYLKNCGDCCDWLKLVRYIKRHLNVSVYMYLMDDR